MSVSHRYPSLDGLRGIASLSVVITHFQLIFLLVIPNEGSLNYDSPIFKIIMSSFNGHFAVCVFFVLSGVALTSGFERYRTNEYISTSILKRYFRLTPVILFSITFSFIIYKLGGYKYVEMARFIENNKWISSLFPENMDIMPALYQGMVGSFLGDFSYNGVLWTMQFEMWGSIGLLLFCSIFYFNKHFTKIALITVACLIYMRGEYGIYYALFICGAMCLKFKNYKSTPILILPALYLGYQIYSSDLVILLTEQQQKMNINLGFPIEYLLHAIGAMILTYSVMTSKVLIELLSKRMFVWLGEISFPLYAVHLPILASLGFSIFIGTHEYIGVKAAAILCMVTALIASIALSQLISKYIDTPAQTKSAELINRISL
ncbi:acyltransferase [Escherichia coli]|uniref:acyltransferase family protein n=2 Tax=Escherichia coli TaxID=562 RepID=UPI000DA44328|nr:acyltransferase [Escherichia coli]EEW0664865.1 acyltransferase [Escherichia coli]EFE6011966.1 acyltransferase [Escherichia coli]EFN4197378.1 acyltransferase [Escherichia coli]EFN9478238.1 acyltransferase [Escherichia coli]EFO2018805.1 acyltransferase [Escherichia coli]